MRERRARVCLTRMFYFNRMIQKHSFQEDPNFKKKEEEHLIIICIGAFDRLCLLLLLLRIDGNVFRFGFVT